jgi:hypothetical protein
MEKSMPHIVINEEQARIIAGATEGVEIRDPQGRHMGYVAHGFTEDDIAIARQRCTSDEPRYTTPEVMDHLKSLEDK